jgi:phosphatidylinositol-bisphosphatase
VACKQLVGLYLTVWARKRLARGVRGVQAAAAATGWGGYLGNKGGVAVRLRVHDAGLVLVCTHLASGDAEGDEQRRNADVREILRRCVFDGLDGQAGGLVVMWGACC